MAEPHVRGGRQLCLAKPHARATISLGSQLKMGEGKKVGQLTHEKDRRRQERERGYEGLQGKEIEGEKERRFTPLVPLIHS